MGVNSWDVNIYKRRMERPTFQATSRLRNAMGRWWSLPRYASLQDEDEEETALQWGLFQKYHARGSWKGIWTTYDYLGDVMDETVASVNLNPVHPEKGGGDNSPARVEHSHTIVVGAKRSDCATCFDSFDCKTIPVAVYSPGQLGKGRCASCSMVVGPSVLRSGAMATELILALGDGRVRVIFYHAPVWQASKGDKEDEDSIEKVGPPDGLKLYRVMIAKEALRSMAPTPENEALLEDNVSNGDSSQQNQPRFYRPVPPYAWHNKWGGTSWTWGPSTGNRGWRIEEMEEADAWQGRPTGDAPNVWSLRLNAGGILVQAPRVVVSGEAGLCRVAWLPNDETLLRVEASVLALEPVVSDDDNEDDEVISFHPPSLASLRCDMMQTMGDLEDLPRFVENNEFVDSQQASNSAQRNVGDEPSLSVPQSGSPVSISSKENESENDDKDNVQALLNSLKL